MDVDDEVVSSLPIRISNRLALQIHQFPLLARPLQPPPSAIASGKRVKARIKAGVRRIEVHVPSDTRQDVWNAERGKELGAARAEDDREKNQASVAKSEKDEPRLSEVRLQSEPIKQNGVHMLGVVRNGELHLHPIHETHQFRPTLTYLDYISTKNRRRGGGDSDSEEDDEPPPDPDEAPVARPLKRARNPSGDAKEIHVTARKAVDEKSMTFGGLTSQRRDMLLAIRAEEDEEWQNLEYQDMESSHAGEVFENIFSQNDAELDCHTDITTYLKSIEGL